MHFDLRLNRVRIKDDMITSKRLSVRIKFEECERHIILPYILFESCLNNPKKIVSCV